MQQRKEREKTKKGQNFREKGLTNRIGPGLFEKKKKKN